jgi:ATP-binding cassette subfamily B protein
VGTASPQGVSIVRYRRLAADYLATQPLRVALLAVVLLVGVGLQLLSPQLLRRFIDSAYRGEATEVLLGIASLFLATSLLRYAFGIGEAYLGELVAWTATNKLRSELIAHLLRTDLAFHEARPSGELVERVDGDVSQLSSLLSSLVFRMIAQVLLVVGALSVAAWIDWRIAAVLGAYACLALVLLNRMRGYATPQAAAAQQARATLDGFVEERLGATEDIRSSGAVPFVMRGLFATMRHAWRMDLRAWLKSVTVNNAAWLVGVSGQATSLAVGGYLYWTGDVSLGTVFLIHQYALAIGEPIQGLAQGVENLQHAGASVGRIDELLAVPVAIAPSGSAPLPGGALSVDVAGVSFEYVAGQPILQDVSFHLDAGEVLGVFGRTGSGKSTLAKVIARFYDPTHGWIVLGGVDTVRTELADLRRRVGFLPQEVRLFRGTIRDNITMFDDAVPNSAVLRAIEEVGLREWYDRLPGGLDTELAADASGVSAGEAQLIALARLFLRDPGLVVMDESWSYADPATAARVQAAVTRLLAGRTGIVIAHRLSVVELADTILVLEDGRIRDFGPRAKLLERPESASATLLRSQDGLEVPT